MHLECNHGVVARMAHFIAAHHGVTCGVSSYCRDYSPSFRPNLVLRPQDAIETSGECLTPGLSYAIEMG